MRINPLEATLLALALATAPAHARQAAAPDAAAEWTEEDWARFRQTVERAADERLDTVPAGRAMATIGRWFIGAPYRPATLELPGPERLVVNLREFDCVTFVEHVTALARFVRDGGAALLAADSAGARARYEALLRGLRYRGGRIDGYASRLHYFSEWLAQQAAEGAITPMGPALGAEPDARPIHFMTRHPAAYRQLADPATLAAVAAHERALGAAGPRLVVPVARVAAIEPLLQEGDILAMASTVDGLDVVHVGLAVRVEGRVHLLNAPLVGRSVEIAPHPLPAHLAARPTQWGVIVARP